MPTAAPAAPPAAPAADVPRHVADLSDVQRCADSKKDNLMDRTDANTQSWIAFRFTFYMAVINRCNVRSQLNTLSPFTDAAPCCSSGSPCCELYVAPGRAGPVSRAIYPEDPSLWGTGGVTWGVRWGCPPLLSF